MGQVLLAPFESVSWQALTIEAAKRAPGQFQTSADWISTGPVHEQASMLHT